MDLKEWEKKMFEVMCVITYTGVVFILGMIIGALLKL